MAARIARSITKSVLSKEQSEGDGARGKIIFIKIFLKKGINSAFLF